MNPKLSLTAIVVLAVTAHVAAEMHIIIADHETGRVIKIKPDGTLLWGARNDNGHDVQLLPNGNTLISIARDGVIREVSPDKKTVRTIRSPAMKHPCTLVVVDE